MFVGVQLTIGARQANLAHVSIDEAGLLDYYTNQFVPALLVDYNHHLFTHLDITRSSSTGEWITPNSWETENEI